MARPRRRSGPRGWPGPLRPAGRFVADVGDHWSRERRALRAGGVALLLAAVADLGAGLVLLSSEGRLAEVPGLLLLIPAAIAMRGATFGAFGARLGTALAVGTYDAELRPGSWLGRQVEAVAILTLVTSLEAALLADVVAGAFGQPTVPLADLVVISVLGGLVASVALLAVTLVLARQSQQRDWSMDDVGAPAITATGDLLAIPALLLATAAAGLGTPTGVLAWAFVVLTLAASAWGLLHPRPEIRRLVRESMVVLTIAALVSVLAGAVVEGRDDVFLAVPALLLVLPPFVAMFGSLGGVLSSRLTSKLHLGLLEPTLRPQREAVLDVSMTFLLSTAVYAFIGAASWVLTLLLGTPAPSLGALVGVTLLGGLLGTALLSVVAYGAASATYRLGLDPDNHAIPVVTSTMDLLGVLCLVGAVAALGVAA